ncbi:MAG TPA: SusC/RagA family TonB-linked outer membrane protein [Chryseolinea sp.]|nr:SusC/RagA family TonB-linked outer membrane protein [Chryseolinea sp.]
MNSNFYKNKQRWRCLFSILVSMLLVSEVFAGAPAAAITVNGRVTSSEDGSGIPGVNVVVKGTQTGTITDAEGKYSLTTADDNGTLVFSYIGFLSQEVAIGGKSVIDVSMEPSMESLNEVVVTALGIQREEQSLGYSVGKVKGADITNVAQENVLNSLAGRVAGVTINSTGGAGSSVRMTIRGTKSLVNDNQPLFVIDGVPVVNSLNNISQVGSDNRVDYGNAISDLNPEIIESISVLKGPSAAALYGSRAGNGVVIITTKNGSKSKKVTVNVTSNTVFDIPYKYLDMHTKFATGLLPFTPNQNPYPGGVLQIDEASAGGVGPELDKGYNAIQWNSPLDADGNPIPTPLISHKDNIKNFVQTGITTTNGVSIANSNDMLNYRLSYSNMANRGIIPNSDLFKNALSLNTSVKVAPKVTVSSSLDLSRSNSNNRPATNRGANPMQWAYAVSPHIDIRDLRNYWVPGQEGLQQLTQDNAAGEYNNPYFLAYEVNNSFVRDRVFGNLKADWQITPEFNLMGRYSLDTYNEQRQTTMANSYTNQSRGAYGISNIKEFERNIDFLLTYQKSFNPISITTSVGANNRSSTSSNSYDRARSGTGLVIPGLYTLGNIRPSDLEFGSALYKKAVYSVYGLVNLGFKDMIYLDITARNDWSSTLPETNRSYFYPAVSLSILANEMFKMPSQISLLKIRGGVAQAGNDTRSYNLNQVLDGMEAWGDVTRLSKSGYVLTPDLKPEKETSYEGGLDFNLFSNKIRFGATYYYLENRNQILSNQISPSSGFTNLTFNAGLVVSKGLELTLGATPIDKNGFRLDANLNFSKNQSIIQELGGGQTIYTFWTDAKGGAWTYVGDKIGDIYDAQLVTVTDKNSQYYGYPLLDEDGSWQDVSAANAKNRIGNYNPDFLVGMQTSLSYKRFTLNLSFDWRQGGEFVSQTYRYGESDLKSQRFLDHLINPNGLEGDALRNYLVANQDQLVKVTDQFNIVGGPTAEYGGFPFEYNGESYPYGVFNPGVIAEYDDEGNITGYVENLGNPGTKIIPYGDNYPWNFTKAATFDASFIKLREISLGYAIPTSLTKRIGLQAASISVYSRNIMLWTKAQIGIDPETAFQQETSAGGGMQFKQGIERYNVIPWTMPIGFKLNLTF